MVERTDCLHLLDLDVHVLQKPFACRLVVLDQRLTLLEEIITVIDQSVLVVVLLSDILDQRIAEQVNPLLNLGGEGPSTGNAELDANSSLDDCSIAINQISDFTSGLLFFVGLSD